MRVRFGEFQLDSTTRQLLRGDDELRLSRKAFDLLVTLLERRPAVVDKETLRERLWPGTTVVEANLNNLASEIRTVLDDDPNQPKYLRTVHRVGYAFCGLAAEDARAHAGNSPRCWLVWNDRSFVIDEEETVIGRDPGSGVWLDAPGVSRRHARIRLANDASTAILEDLDSTNGTYVDGRLVTRPVPLEDGDSVRIGEATLTFRTGSAVNAPTKRIGRKDGRKR